jgi:hypothetical protein
MYSRGRTIARLIFGLDQLPCQQKVGDILVTAIRSQAYDGAAFATNLNNFRKRILQPLFSKGVSIVTRSDSGRMHSHIAAEMPSLCSDFDWTSFEQSEHYYRLYQQYKGKDDLKFYRYFTAKYRRSLPKDWQDINTKLMIAGKRYGLGRVFLTPIRKNLKAYKWYLVSNVPWKRDKRDSKIHYLSCWGMKSTGKFQVLNKFTNDYRRKISKFVQGLHLDSENYNICLRSMLGQRWFFRIKELIRNIDSLSVIQQIQYDELKSSIRTHILRSS